MFGTLQGRLPKDLRVAGITMVEAANAWLKAHYIAEHNAAFAIKPQQQGTAFVVDRHEAWREALCVIQERIVANDNTIAWAVDICSCRIAGSGPTSSRRWCGFTTIPMAS